MINLSLIRPSLYERIAEVLRKEVLSLPVGHKLDCENKLARRFSVSTVTIRSALQTLTQEKLIQRRHGSGTYVLEKPLQQHVGILIELDISCPGISYFYRRVTQQLRFFFQQQGLREKLYVGQVQPGVQATRLTCGEFLEDAQHNRLAGVAAISTLPFPEWLGILKANDTPVVGPAPGYPFAVGAGDSREMVRYGTRQMIEKGRKRLWFVQPGRIDEDDPLVALFHAALREAGLNPEHSRALHIPRSSTAGAAWQAFLRAWSQEPEKPDGMLISDDMLFQAIVPAILELGIHVPDRLMVVTHANRGSGMVIPFPTLCLETDPDAYAQTMGEMLLRLMRKEPVPQPTVILPFHPRPIIPLPPSSESDETTAGLTPSVSPNEPHRAIPTSH